MLRLTAEQLGSSLLLFTLNDHTKPTRICSRSPRFARATNYTCQTSEVIIAAVFQRRSVLMTWTHLAPETCAERLSYLAGQRGLGGAPSWGGESGDALLQAVEHPSVGNRVTSNHRESVMFTYHMQEALLRSRTIFWWLPISVSLVLLHNIVKLGAQQGTPRLRSEPRWVVRVG